MKAFRTPVLLCAVAVLAIGVAACAPAAPAPEPAAPAAPPPPAEKPVEAENEVLAEIIEGARQESVLKATWSATSFGGAEGLDKLVAGMNQRYGTNITAQFTPGPTMTRVMEIVATEYAAGQPATSDVYLGNAQAIFNAREFDNLMSFDWEAILDRPLPRTDEFDPIAPGGTGIAFGSTAVGILYNADVVTGDDIPTSIEDPLDPQWEGRIAATVVASGVREFAADDMLGWEFTREYTERLAQQVGGAIRCGEHDRVLSREFVMMVYTCGGQEANRAQMIGTPLGHSVMQEAVPIHPRYAAVPKNSESPNAAALLIAYLHSEEGQQVLWEEDGMDSHIYETSNMHSQIQEALETPGARTAVTTVQRLIEHDYLSEREAELVSIIVGG